MFIMINGELLNMQNVTAVSPPREGPGCIVQFVGGGSRYYLAHGPECFAQAIISGCVVHFMDGKDGDEDHEC
jgi:hypothetical protein